MQNNSVLDISHQKILEKPNKIVAKKHEDSKASEWSDKLAQSGLSEIIKKYLEDANLLKNELLQSAIKKLEAGSDPDLVVEELAGKLTNKLLHTTFKSIKKSPKINLEQSKDFVPVSKKPTNIHNS